jgi:hypothetical protein
VVADAENAVNPQPTILPLKSKQCIFGKNFFDCVLELSIATDVNQWNPIRNAEFNL